MRARASLLVVVGVVPLVVFVSCGGQEQPGGAGPADAPAESAMDSTLEVATDAAFDASIDAAPDSAIDGTFDLDSGVDAPEDDADAAPEDAVALDTAPDDAGCAPVDFDADVQPILSASCAIVGCHAGSASTGGLDLSAGHAFASLRVSSSKECGGKPLVVPYDPDDSVLWQKVDGAPPPCGGSTMPPPSAGGFSDADRRTLYCWIEEGAKP